MNEPIKPLITEEEIKTRVKELGKQISEDYKGETVTLICILKGSVVFMVDLARAISIDVEFDFMEVSSYGNSRVSNGIVKINKDIETAVTGKNVLIVEDIIDTGRTLTHLMRHLEAQQPKSIKICTLLDKPSRRIEETIVAQYIGFSIPDRFVAGYGLDKEQKCRNLSYIGVLD